MHNYITIPHISDYELEKKILILYLSKYGIFTQLHIHICMCVLKDNTCRLLAYITIYEQYRQIS